MHKNQNLISFVVVIIISTVICFFIIIIIIICCRPLNNSDELKNYLDSMYSSGAQYNKPPTYPVNMICKGIDGTTDDDIISKIAGGVVSYKGNRSCYINPPSNVSETSTGWGWQVFIYLFN